MIDARMMIIITIIVEIHKLYLKKSECGIYFIDCQMQIYEFYIDHAKIDLPIKNRLVIVWNCSG